MRFSWPENLSREQCPKSNCHTIKLGKDLVPLKELRRENTSARGREAAFGTQTRREAGEQTGAKAGCWGDVGTRREQWGGGLILSTSRPKGLCRQTGKGQANGSGKAAVVY